MAKNITKEVQTTQARCRPVRRLLPPLLSGAIPALILERFKNFDVNSDNSDNKNYLQTLTRLALLKSGYRLDAVDPVATPEAATNSGWPTPNKLDLQLNTYYFREDLTGINLNKLEGQWGKLGRMTAGQLVIVCDTGQNEFPTGLLAPDPEVFEINSLLLYASAEVKTKEGVGIPDVRSHTIADGLVAAT